MGSVMDQERPWERDERERRKKQEDQPHHMWSYWKDKHGTLAALKDYYPNLIKSNPLLAHAVAQMETAELVIKTTMSKLQEEDDSADD